MEKCYYAYCRPKLPNHPWSLERIPFNRSVLSINKEKVNLKAGKIVPFNFKDLDEIGISLGSDGSFILPIGKYLLEFYSLIEIPVAGNVEIIIDDHKISLCIDASTPTSITGKVIINITDDNKELKFISNSKDQIKLSDTNIIINKL